MGNITRRYGRQAIIAGSLTLSIALLALPLYRPGELPVFLLLLGRFHPLILHFPIVLILLALIFEVVRRFRLLKQADGVVMIILVAAALSTLVSIMAGFFLFASGDYSGRLMEQHFWAGAITGAAIFITVAMFFINRSTSRFYVPYAVFLLVSNAAVGFTGHLGGSITHGPDYLTEYLPFIMRKVEKMESKPVEEMLVYEDMLSPILEAKCMSCHNSIRAKGGLLMASYPDLLKGGESGSTAISAGDPEKSELFNRITLPDDDDDRMPPEGKSPMTNNEVALLRYWIQSGASPELKVMDAKEQKEIKPVIEALLPELVRYRRKSVIANLKARALRAELNDLSKKITVSIQPDSAVEGNYFVLAMKFPPAPFTNDQFRELMPYADVFSRASLVASGIDDAGLYYISHMVNLRALYLQKTSLDGTGLAYLQNLPNLEVLNLSFTKIDDKAALDLLKIPNLREVYLFGTGASREVIEAMRKYRPGLTILVEEGPYL